MEFAMHIELVRNDVGFFTNPSPDASFAERPNLRISASTLYTPDLPIISFMHCNVHELEFFGCSCKKYRPLFICNLYSIVTNFMCLTAFFQFEYMALSLSSDFPQLRV